MLCQDIILSEQQVIYEPIGQTLMSGLRLPVNARIHTDSYRHDSKVLWQDTHNLEPTAGSAVGVPDIAAASSSVNPMSLSSRRGTGLRGLSPCQQRPSAA